MSFHRIGVAALVLACASGAQIMQARACDERIAGSCPGAPITNPGVAVEAGEAPPATEQAERAARKSVRRRHSARHRVRHHRRRAAATARAKPETAKAASAGESTRGIDLKRPAPRDPTPENVGTSDEAVAETWAKVPITLKSPLPRPKPMPQLAAPDSVRPTAQADTAPAPVPVRANFVTTTSIRPPAAAQAKEQVTEVASRDASPEPAQPSMTALRAIALACAGLLALGTAVRMVI
jgi:hypothetical protein